VVGVVLLAGVAFIAYTSMQLDAKNRALIDDIFRPLSAPPVRLVVCRGAMDTACAQEAADRVGTTVAWLDDPPGYELEWMFATGDPVIPDGGVIATQYFVGTDGQGMFEVLTSVPPLPPGPIPPQSRPVSNGEDTGSIWVEEVSGIASVEWTHDGIKYIITAQPRPWDPSAVVDVWRTVQYAVPRG
jgi:hypothetical protein